jgi:hypothetical protein
VSTRFLATALDRRAFLGRMVVSVGGVAIASALPVSLLEASPACLASDPCGDWQLDDMCGAYPPYAFRRHADHPRDARHDVAHRDGLDALFMA